MSFHKGVFETGIPARFRLLYNRVNADRFMQKAFIIIINKTVVHSLSGMCTAISIYNTGGGYGSECHQGTSRST